MDISVVVPVYGCPNAVRPLYERLNLTLSYMKISYEIIMVDDCDSLNSWDEVRNIAIMDTNVRALHFTRNYGQGSAITAGVRIAKGNWIVTMDCDLQDAPENIPPLYSKALEGFDVVFVRRQERKESLSVRVMAKIYHGLLSWFSEVPYDYDLGTFLIASRRAAEYYCTSKDRGRDFGMFLMWLGFRHAYVYFEQNKRYEGKSSYTFIKKWKYAIGVMTSFSNRILYIPVWIGGISAIISFVYIIIVFVSYFAYNANPRGWSAVAAALFFFGGAILSTLGIMGIYLGNIMDMNKERPLYAIQESINCEIGELNVTDK